MSLTKYGQNNYIYWKPGQMMTPPINENQNKMKLGDTVYLLPLFLSTLLRSLHISKKTFYQDVAKHLDKRLEDAFERLKAINQTIEEGARKEVKSLTKLHRALTGTGGRQVDVLEKLEQVLHALEQYHYVNHLDKEHLEDILNAHEHMFKGSYDSGLESRTIDRILKCDEKPTVKQFSIQIVIEVLASYLSNERTKYYFFTNVLLDAERVKSRFFHYRGMAVKLDSIDHLANAILEIKQSEEGDYSSALNEIARLMRLYQQATLVESEPDINLTSDQQLDIWEEDNNFYLDAMNYIKKTMCLNEIIKAEAKENAPYYLQIVDEAHTLFLKIWNQRDETSKSAASYNALLHELVLHSLHSQDQIHASLCQSFRQWLQE